MSTLVTWQCAAWLQGTPAGAGQTWVSLPTPSLLGAGGHVTSPLSASVTSSVKGEKVWYVLGTARGTWQVRVVVCDVKALCKGLFPVL